MSSQDIRRCIWDQLREKDLRAFSNFKSEHATCPRSDWRSAVDRSVGGDAGVGGRSQAAR